MLREISEVVGTNDARHVLALCTDGGVMYYKRQEADESAEFIEFQGLQRNAELDHVWGLKRVGALGDVVLLRATRSVDGTCTLIQVNVLAGMRNYNDEFFSSSFHLKFYFILIITSSYFLILLDGRV